LLDTNTARLDGAVGGGQAGYKLQIGPQWVVGAEADIQALGERRTTTFVDPIAGALCTGGTVGPTCFRTNPFSGAALMQHEARIGWFGTLRGRLGFLVAQQVLLYGTGGLAYGRVEVSDITSVAATAPFGQFGPTIAAVTASKTKTGYSVGAGIEGTLWLGPYWTWKLEYLYLDLRSLDATSAFSAAPSSFGAFFFTRDGDD